MENLHNTYGNLLNWLIELERDSMPDLNDEELINYTINDLEDKISDYDFSTRKTNECYNAVEQMYKTGGLTNVKEVTIYTVMAIIINFFLYECFEEYAESLEEFNELCDRYNIINDPDVRKKVFKMINKLED